MYFEIGESSKTIMTRFQALLLCSVIILSSTVVSPVNGMCRYVYIHRTIITSDIINTAITY